MNDTFKKFAVLFLDPDKDPEDDTLDNNTFYGYQASVPVNLPESTFVQIIETDPRIKALEHAYGILDVSGNTEKIGFDSYEIEMADAGHVFSELCDIFKNYITGPKTEQFTPLPTKD